MATTNRTVKSRNERAQSDSCSDSPRLPVDVSTVEAERTVLHRLLRDNALFDDVAAIVRAEDFVSFTHQTIFRIIGRLIAKGTLAEPVTVFDAAREEELVADVQPDYLIDLYSSFTSHDAVVYAQIVRRHSILRRLREVGRTIAADAEDHAGDAETQLENAEKAILDIADAGTQCRSIDAEQASRETFILLKQRIDRYAQGKISGVATGLERFDQITGGFQPSEVAIVAARTSVGKTVFALNVTSAACEAGVPVLFVTLEQPGSELLMRLWSKIAGVDSWRIRRGCLHHREIQLMANARDETAKWPVSIADEPGQTIAHIAATARRHKRKGKLGLLVIDYLGLIESEDRKLPRHEQVTSITRRIKLLARQLNVPVLLLCQLNREADKEAPRLSHLRESGSIEQDADTVILLHREDDRQPDLVPAEWIDIRLDIAKQRNGPTEILFIKMHRPTFRFVDKEES